MPGTTRKTTRTTRPRRQKYRSFKTLIPLPVYAFLRTGQKSLEGGIMKNRRYILPGLGLLAIQTAIAGPMNFGPPAGAILDLAGTPDPTVYTNYTVSFVAAAANTD